MQADPGHHRRGTYSGYSVGCRCEPCRQAGSEYRRAWRRRLYEALQSDPAHPKHGTPSGYDAGCRCARCFEAGNKQRARVRGRLLEARLKDLIREVVDEKGAWLVEMEVMPDHVRLLVEVDPQYGIHRL